MINAVIIEDETLAATRLVAMVKKYDPSIQIQAQLPSVKKAVQWFRQNAHPDLIFMDIHLEDGLSFSIFEQIDIEIPVIFTTAFDEYTIKAFKVNSVDYLLKPINQEELAFALDKLKKTKPTVHYYNVNGEISVENLKRSTVKSRFLVSAGSKIASVQVEDIAYFFSEEKITFLRTFSGQRYAIEYSLDNLAHLLDTNTFFKINRQLIIHIRSINSIHKVSTSRLKITLHPDLGKDMFVSIDKYSKFKDWLDA